MYLELSIIGSLSLLSLSGSLLMTKLTRPLPRKAPILLGIWQLRYGTHRSLAPPSSFRCSSPLFLSVLPMVAVSPEIPSTTSTGRKRKTVEPLPRSLLMTRIGGSRSNIAGDGLVERWDMEWG